MKYFIEGRERKIYFTKDNTAFYKSKGNNIDVTYMFKKTKNGLELRKKYLKTGGVQLEWKEKASKIGQGALQSFRNAFTSADAKNEKRLAEAQAELNKLRDKQDKQEKDFYVEVEAKKKDLITTIPSFFKSLQHDIRTIDEDTKQSFYKLNNVIETTGEDENPSETHYDLYNKVKDKSIELADKLYGIAEQIKKLDPKIKMHIQTSEFDGSKYIIFLYEHGYFKPKILDIKSEDFEDIFVKVAWRYLDAKLNHIGTEQLSYTPDVRQAAKDRFKMINALKQAANEVDVEVPTEEEVAAKEAEHEKYREQQRIANKEEDAMRRDMAGKGSHYDNFTNLKERERGVSSDEVYGGYKKSNKKSNKKSDKNTDRKSTKKASKKTKK